MNTVDKTFWELTNECLINIPIIQRDYAQGREEEKEKRDKFLAAIYKHLIADEDLDLDFVYGRLTEGIFYPIDGQQRLTTLFLLHWYISIKEKRVSDAKNNLLKFVYDTRISSREFCKTLVTHVTAIPLKSEKGSFIEEIQNSHWFRNTWNKDPTIKSMLIMIQAIHEKFNEVSDINLWDKLISDRLITFQWLDLGAKGFELTDELYIKMNARGKQLTPFENFKATFIQFIDRCYPASRLSHPLKGHISYAGYFSYKIEKEWTDLFWTYRGDKFIIDEMFMNFFRYFSQLFYFLNNPDAKADDFKNNFTQYEEIYKNEDNLIFLFNFLDKLYEISLKEGATDKDGVQTFFESLFQKKKNDSETSESITLFWNTSNEVNLFKRSINNGLNEDPRNKIVLYCILSYLVKFKLNNVSDGLKLFVRVVRNLMQATRQRPETKYTTNVRINNFGTYWILLRALATENVYETLRCQLESRGSQIGEESLNQEKIKAGICNDNNKKKDIAALEEHKYFGGLIHQLKPDKNVDKLHAYIQAIEEIWDDNISDTLKIQALISVGFEGLLIKPIIKMGATYYFGKTGNWTAILTSNDEKISESLLSLLDEYLLQGAVSPQSKLELIRDKWLKENKNDRTWKYYFLKYSYFTSKINYYAWEDDFEIRILSTEGFNPLVAFHINPYVLSVCEIINDRNICRVEDCYQQYSGNSPLVLRNGMSLTSTSSGWLLFNNQIILPQEIIKKYKLLNGPNQFIFLKEIDSRDRIGIAVDFVKDVIVL